MTITPDPLNYLYGTSKERLNLTSSPGSEWEIQSVCSSDNSSVSAWSSIESFTTITACTTPLNTTTTAIGLTDATLGWDVSPGALEYIVRYKKVNQGWGTFTSITVTTNSLVLSSLSQGTAYHWQVKSVCDANGNNNSGFSSFDVFNTGSCNASLNISQTNVGCFGGNDGSLTGLDQKLNMLQHASALQEQNLSQLQELLEDPSPSSFR